jgi:ABC-2 type transport system ATP-binding protein
MPPLKSRHGIGLLHVRDVEIQGAAEGAPPVPGGSLTARIHYDAECIVKRPVIGIAIHDAGGSFLLGPNTRAQGMVIASLEGRGTVEWHVPCLPLQPGTYHLTVAFFNHALDVVYDYCDRMFPFVVAGADPEVPGVLSVPSEFRQPVPAPPPGPEPPPEAATIPAMAVAEGPPA